jgi:hypothetical protein
MGDYLAALAQCKADKADGRIRSVKRPDGSFMSQVDGSFMSPACDKMVILADDLIRKGELVKKNK